MSENEHLIRALARASLMVAGEGAGTSDVAESLASLEGGLAGGEVRVRVRSEGLSAPDGPAVSGPEPERLASRLRDRGVDALVLRSGTRIGEVIRLLKAVEASTDREQLESRLRIDPPASIGVEFQGGGSVLGGLARSIRSLYPEEARTVSPSADAPLPPDVAGPAPAIPGGPPGPRRTVFHAGVLDRSEPLDAVREVPPSVEGVAPSPDAEGAAEGEGKAFLKDVRAFLEGAPERRIQLAAGLRERGGQLAARGEVDPVSEGVLLLAAAAGAEESDAGAGALARELGQPRVIRRMVVIAGGRVGEDDKERFLRAAVFLATETATALGDALTDDPDRRARRLYLEALSALGDQGRVAAEAMLDDPRWFVVRNGISLLGEFGGDEAVSHLTQTLAHGDPRVRREAVMALAKLGGDDAAILLLGMLGDGDPDVRGAVVLGLGALHVERAVRPLLESLEKEEDEDLVVAILRTLGQLGDPGAVQAVERKALGTFFTRPSRPIRIAAYRALAAIGTPHARSVLKAGEEEKDPEVRSAVQALLQAGG